MGSALWIIFAQAKEFSLGQNLSRPGQKKIIIFLFLLFVSECLAFFECNICIE